MPRIGVSCIAAFLLTPSGILLSQTAPTNPGSGSNYDKAIFQKPIPPDQLAFLNQYAGAPSDKLYRDKQFRKVMRAAIPDCVFHYGRDMTLSDALDLVLKGSTLPVQIRDGRFVTLSGRRGPYLAGRGFLWIDMQDGIWVDSISIPPTASRRRWSMSFPGR
jgi:hypothetical protein